MFQNKMRRGSKMGTAQHLPLSAITCPADKVQPECGSDIQRAPLHFFVRIGLALLSTLISVALLWTLLAGAHIAVHASSPTIRETSLPSAIPWGVSFDNNNNVWVAEPGCDAAPICGPQIGNIAQYNRQSFALIQNFTEPAGYSSPLFLAVDSSNNIWFTEPATDAIGELTVTNGNPSWQQWSVPTADAMPYDLTIDWSGHIWFTEHNRDTIGEFDPVQQQFTETNTPTANSNPYGIVGPDPATGSIWFTENNSAVARIGRFTPPPAGALSTGNIDEYLTKNDSNTTPHLITFDSVGNVWWTEGWDGRIGRLAINAAQNGTSNGVTEYAVPPPNCGGSSNCGVHISGIGVDSANTVWFDDSLSSRIGSFVPATSTFSIFTVGGGAGSGSHPHDGLAVDGENNVWFTEEFASKLGEALPTNGPPPTPGVTSTPTTTGTPPVNRNWYFAEGRVGRGFQEFVTLDNPAPTTSCVVNVEYMYTPDGGAPTRKMLAVTLAPVTRWTQGVNNDLGFSATGSAAATVSTVVTVDTSRSPNCGGVVAERPMYYHFGGAQSGSDALGTTHTSTSFYFADVPTGGGYASFLTLLNPGAQTAHVTVNYYANGQKVNSQTQVVAAGTRGTIDPNSLRLPQHVAAALTSDEPIVVERPDYFSNVNGGNAGMVSGGACVVGAQSPGYDWLFAEGATWSNFQEYLAIANLDSAANATAQVTITLEFTNGTSRTFTLAVKQNSVVMWNVNANMGAGDVSAEVTSTGAKVVVEREMFFQYAIGGASTPAIGGTDVVGQAGPAAQSTYSFAEGYLGTGFNEWLTLQNPTGATERLYLTLMNGNGQTYAQWFTIGGHTRMTVNITALVLQHLAANRSVAMSVVSEGSVPFVAERPQYWNVGGTLPTRGGTDVIGYTGQ